MSQLITHRYSMFLFIRAFLKTSKVFVINFSKGKTTVEDPVEGLEALRCLSFNIVSSFLFSVFSLTFPLRGGSLNFLLGQSHVCLAWVTAP